jgi:hypothetical protein
MHMARKGMRDVQQNACKQAEIGDRIVLNGGSPARTTRCQRTTVSGLLVLSKAGVQVQPLAQLGHRHDSNLAHLDRPDVRAGRSDGSCSG